MGNKTEIDNDLITTPVQLEAMRKMLGLSQGECGLLLGGAGPDDVRQLEKPSASFCYIEHEAVLTDMLDRVDDLLADHSVKPPALPYLITYRGDDDFAVLDPAQAKWMRFATVHRMYVGRLWRELAASGYYTAVVALSPENFAKYLNDRQIEDSPLARLEWAADTASKYWLREGSPRQVKDAEKAIAHRQSGLPPRKRFRRPEPQLDPEITTDRYVDLIEKIEQRLPEVERVAEIWETDNDGRQHPFRHTIRAFLRIRRRVTGLGHDARMEWLEDVAGTFGLGMDVNEWIAQQNSGLRSERAQDRRDRLAAQRAAAPPKERFGREPWKR